MGQLEPYLQPPIGLVILLCAIATFVVLGWIGLAVAALRERRVWTPPTGDSRRGLYALACLALTALAFVYLSAIVTGLRPPMAVRWDVFVLGLGTGVAYGVFGIQAILRGLKGWGRSPRSWRCAS